MPTAELIGDEQGVSHMTVKRAAEYANAIDTLTETLGKETTQKKQQGGTGANQYKEQRDQNDPSAKTAEKIGDAPGAAVRVARLHSRDRCNNIAQERDVTSPA
ncbi:MAG: hypothetical protein M0Q91_16965 [Methanoregula sp.]|jgi:hypothetical protein|nr:hypothetical protein [Methanoregula sp.]